MNRFIALSVAGILAIGAIAFSGQQDDAAARGCSGPRLGGRCGGAAADCCAPARAKRDRCSGRHARRCAGAADCSAPAPVCDPAPACCAPAPSCEPDPCSCGGRPSLRERLAARRAAKCCGAAVTCCEPAPACGCPACGEVVEEAAPMEAAEEAGEAAEAAADGAAEASIRPLTLRFVAFR